MHNAYIETAHYHSITSKALDPIFHNSGKICISRRVYILVLSSHKLLHCFIRRRFGGFGSPLIGKWQLTVEAIRCFDI